MLWTSTRTSNTKICWLEPLFSCSCAYSTVYSLSGCKLVFVVEVLENSYDLGVIMHQLKRYKAYYNRTNKCAPTLESILRSFKESREGGSDT